MSLKITDLHILSAKDLTAFDRTVRMAMEGRGIHEFDERYDTWKTCSSYTNFLKSANDSANEVIQHD